MILDYKNNKEFAFKNGIQPENNIGEVWFCGESVCEGITFTNFHHLCLSNTIFKNCIFEKCHEISAESCRMSDCVFKNVDNIMGQYTDFQDSVFKDCCSNGPLLVIDSSGRVDNCTFETITTLGENGYVVSASFNSKDDVTQIINCKFVDCQVESEDGELCHCLYFEPVLSFKTVLVDNVYCDTCEVIL